MAKKYITSLIKDENGKVVGFQSVELDQDFGDLHITKDGQQISAHESVLIDGEQAQQTVGLIENLELHLKAKGFMRWLDQTMNDMGIKRWGDDDDELHF